MAKKQSRRPSLAGTELAQVIGGRIREERKRAGLTQKVLGKEAGLTDVYIYLLEKGEENPTVGVLADIARALGVELITLLQDNADISSRAGRMRGSIEQLIEMIKEHAALETKLLATILEDAQARRSGATRAVQKKEGED
jgi:transcriptional regulator with XRE-family HTH domain